MLLFCLPDGSFACALLDREIRAVAFGLICTDSQTDLTVICYRKHHLETVFWLIAVMS